MLSSTKQFYAKSRAQWRKWLEKNHATEKNIWLILYNKSSETPCVTRVEAVEEALCFGWIDSKGNKRDKESFILLFANRKPKAVWSKINKAHIEKLIKSGLMTPAGQRKIDAAKADGSWTFLDSIESLVMPDDLQKAFARKKKALKYFEAFPASTRKGIYHWIISAKRDETRKKRVIETVRLAEKNIRANQWVK